MSTLITGQLPNEPKIDSLKYLTHSVYFNHWSITECEPNPISKEANTKCLL